MFCSNRCYDSSDQIGNKVSRMEVVVEAVATRVFCIALSNITFTGNERSFEVETGQKMQTAIIACAIPRQVSFIRTSLMTSVREQGVVVGRQRV